MIRVRPGPSFWRGASNGPRACGDRSRCAGEKTRRPVAVENLWLQPVAEAWKVVQIGFKGARSGAFAAKFDAALTRVDRADMMQWSGFCAARRFVLQVEP